MNEFQEIEWEECCVCDGKEKGDLRPTTKWTVTLAGQFVEFWKNYLLPFDPAMITTNYVVGEDGTEHPDFERVMLRKSARYHHNCHIRYSPYNLARKRKPLRSKNKKAEVRQSSAQIFVHLQVQKFQILFALYAVNMMPLKTFMLLRHVIRLNRNCILNML